MLLLYKKKLFYNNIYYVYWQTNMLVPIGTGDNGSAAKKR